MIVAVVGVLVFAVFVSAVTGVVAVDATAGNAAVERVLFVKAVVAEVVGFGCGSGLEVRGTQCPSIVSGFMTQTRSRLALQ